MIWVLLPRLTISSLKMNFFVMGEVAEPVARWDIPAERMKMEAPHIVPLSQQSVAVLRALRLLTGKGRFVFHGANDKSKPMSNNTILFALYRLGYKSRMTGHGFRGLASTILHENDFAEEHLELQPARAVSFWTSHGANIAI